MSLPVLASGGLVFRAAGEGFEVLVVHRPRYDDWSLPKGKDDPGETSEQAAIREVGEETGQPARIVARLPEIRYEMGNGQTKLVRFFAMRPVGEGSFSPGNEVDQIKWVGAPEAEELLTYRRDRDLVREARFAAWSQTGTLYLIRHAVAGDRSKWEGDDRLRPLTARGEKQAAMLAEDLAGAGLDAILSSPYARCRQTVDPLAERTGVTVREVASLAEGAEWDETWETIKGLTGTNAALCSHGDVIPSILEHLTEQGTRLTSPTGNFDCKKGSVWELSAFEGDWVGAAYRPPPA